MTNTIKELKDQLQAMLDSTDTKEAIEQIGITNSLADKLEVEHQELQAKYDDLFKDYKELVKHTSFAPTGHEQETVPEPKELSFGEFLSNYKKD